MIQASIKVPVYIDNKLEQIIRYLCNNLPENEWSGNLLYQAEGSIENKDLKIFAKYLILKKHQVEYGKRQMKFNADCNTGGK